MNACGHRFASGHRIRIALTSAYWPLIWPAPEVAALGIVAGVSRLSLPHRRPQSTDGIEPFEKPVAGPATPISQVTVGSVKREASFDLVSGAVKYVTDGEGVFGEGRQRFDEIGTEVLHNIRRELTIAPHDPLCASYICKQSYVQSRPGWDIRIDVTCRMSSTHDDFIMTAELDAFENGERFASRNWREVVKRDLL